MLDTLADRRHGWRMAEWLPRVIVVAVVAALVLSVVVSTRSCQEPEPELGRVRADARVDGQQAKAAPRRGESRPDLPESSVGGGSLQPAGEGRLAPPDVARAGRAGSESLPSQNVGQNAPVAGERALVDEPVRQATQSAQEAAAEAAAAAKAAHKDMLEAAASGSGDVPSFAAFRDKDESASEAPSEALGVDFSAEGGAYFPPNAVLGFPNRGGFSPEGGTVMFWLQPVDWDGSVRDSYSFFLLRDPQSLNHMFAILKNQDALRFQVVNDQGVQVAVQWPIGDWTRGEWHHIAATWSSEILDLYVDGVLVGEENAPGIPAVAPNSPAWWGSSRGTNGAGAIIADARIFSQAVSERDILTAAQSVPR